MERSVGPEWTAALVARALQLGLHTQPTLFRGVLDAAGTVLGKHSRDYSALIFRARWPHSRGEPRSDRAAERLATALNRDGVALVDGLQIRAVADGGRPKTGSSQDPDSGESGSPVE
jgi:hypothetical protein